MCGRFTLACDSEKLMQLPLNLEPPINFHPRYNIAPSQAVAVVANTLPDRLLDTGKGQADTVRRVEFFRWGLIPSWAKDSKMGHRMINARSETLAEKPAFRSAYKRRRCLVLADGYYEWTTVPGDKRKQPVYIHLKSGEPFALAGLWEVWQADGVEAPVRSCTIITCPPNRLLAAFHHRMPVILPRAVYAEWLAREARPADLLQPLLVPYSDAEMEVYPVSRGVNRPLNDSPECIMPL